MNHPCPSQTDRESLQCTHLEGAILRTLPRVLRRSDICFWATNSSSNKSALLTSVALRHFTQNLGPPKKSEQQHELRERGVHLSMPYPHPPPPRIEQLFFFFGPRVSSKPEASRNGPVVSEAKNPPPPRGMCGEWKL